MEEGMVNCQLVLLPESVIPVMLYAVTGLELALFESITSRYEMERADCGLMFHCDPLFDERRFNRLFSCPFRVSVPVIV